MKENGKRLLLSGSLLIISFIIWTIIVLNVDVKPLGVNGTNIGLSTINCWFHNLTGVHMGLYNITDWLGLVPVFICMSFGMVGSLQLIRRRNILKVDCDIIILGIYYVIVILAYFMFEILPVNYRPILINGFLEVSYPSSTTLLVLSVMPTFSEQSGRRFMNRTIQKVSRIFTIIFSAFMVIGRLVSGVHWLTDIVGAILLSAGFFCVYKAAILLYHKGEN